MPEKLVFVDVETSGGGPLRDRIIEIGLVVVEDGIKVDSWSSLVNPYCQVMPEVLTMTGIRPQELETAPEFGDIQGEISRWLEGAVFVAHNARFDFAFVKHEFARLDKRVWWPQLCTVRLSRLLFPEARRHGLDAIIERFNLSCTDRHRALGDAEVTADFYLKLKDLFSPETLESSVQSILKQPALPPALANAELERLPEEPGVYLFYGEGDSLLYVGKSINLRDRVWGHFYQDMESPRELALKSQVQRIETRTTTGELEALMLESRLIKERQPLHNRRLRRTCEYWTLGLDQSQQAHRLVIKKHTAVTSGELANLIGVFRRRNQATNLLTALAVKYQLCRRQLGLELGKGPCFGYHLEQCRGVCCGREDASGFNLRLLSALGEIKLPSWPFAGAVGIKEESPTDPEPYVHWFDHWCFLDSQPEGSLLPLPLEGNFDFDLYHILRRYLKTYPESELIQATNQSGPVRGGEDTYLPG